MISLIITILMGAVAGYLASLVMKTNHKQGFLLDVIVGIIGSNVGSWLWTKFSLPLLTHIGWLDSLIIAVIGACILLFIIKLVFSIFKR